MLDLLRGFTQRDSMVDLSSSFSVCLPEGSVMVFPVTAPDGDPRFTAENGEGAGGRGRLFFGSGVTSTHHFGSKKPKKLYSHLLSHLCNCTSYFL